MSNKLSVKSVCVLCQKDIEGFPYSWNICYVSGKRAEISAYVCASCSLVYCADCKKENKKNYAWGGGDKFHCPKCSNLFGGGLAYLDSELGPKEIQKAIKHFQNLLSFDDKQVRIIGKKSIQQAAESLAELGEAGVEALFSHFKPGISLFSEVAWILLRIDEPRAIIQLEKILAGEGQKGVGERTLCVMSADLLAQIKPAATAKLLSDIVVNEEEPLELRQKSADLLGNIKSMDSVPQLNQVLGAKKWNMAPLVATAAEALGKIGDIRAVDPLITALETANASTAVKIAEALGKLNDPRAIEALKRSLTSSHHSVREASARSLKNLNWQPSEEKDKVLLHRSLSEEKDRFCLSCEKPVGDAKSCPHCHIELMSKPYSPGMASGLGYLFGGLMGGISLLIGRLLGAAEVPREVQMLIFGVVAIGSWKKMKVRLTTSRDRALLKPKRRVSDGGSL